ncbi:hypothetical protein HTZ84_22120 [Haloterrigena sp. SYSU A558-1]|uniref:MarR family transcriptional regulator n=1 Tax=Haloterrigena gelatinilytica TaxID=2741724 RepID=A0ABX2LFD6_9EURY|nr:hypothetical protein [Haloterrigena gelatinilytica]NUC74964.1 hypothetical protein [Haloterrigena gelatinilytica]
MGRRIYAPRFPNPYNELHVLGPVTRSDLRLPGDALILWYLYRNGAGTTATIATTIDRKANYVSQRISKLQADDLELVTRVAGPAAEVTLTSRGVAVAEDLPERHIMDYREPIDAATPYSVTWD